MSNMIRKAKKLLDESIETIDQNKSKYLLHPEKDFTRNRKFLFSDISRLLIGMGSGSLSNEILSFCHFSPSCGSESAFIQQRSKISYSAFEDLFRLFSEKIPISKRYKGFRLLAADGSDVHIATNPLDSDSFLPGTNGQKPYNLIHVNALYDLLNHIYVDAVIQKYRNQDERLALITMAAKRSITKDLYIADRGYEGFNLMAHFQENGQYYLVRVKDSASNSIISGLNLPDSPVFDLNIDLNLTNKQSSLMKQLVKEQPNSYRIIQGFQNFDFLPKNSKHKDPPSFYLLSFRIVRFKISDSSFETVVTNLSPDDFSPSDLKYIYSLRWGIETSFRFLKYTVGLNYFHSKKAEFIFQELFARFIMYNLSELITSYIIVHSSPKYSYSVNFSVAVHVCKQFFLGNLSPPSAKAAIARHVSPIRPGRSFSRKVGSKAAISFFYRVA